MAFASPKLSVTTKKYKDKTEMELVKWTLFHSFLEVVSCQNSLVHLNPPAEQVVNPVTSSLTLMPGQHSFFLYNILIFSLQLSVISEKHINPNIQEGRKESEAVFCHNK